MIGKHITQQLYNTEIGHLLRLVGQNIKAGRIRARQSDAAFALVAYFTSANIPDNHRYHAWNDVLGDLVLYADKNIARDGRSNVFFDKDADSESDDE